MKVRFGESIGLWLIVIAVATASCTSSSEPPSQGLNDDQSVEVEQSESPSVSAQDSPNSAIDGDSIAIAPDQKPGSASTDTDTAKPLAEAAPRQPLQLVDEGGSSAEFTQFRNALRQAVQDRDADFIRAIAAPDIRLTFGLPMTIDELDIDNPNALFWKNMEKAIATGCASEIFGVEPEKQTWICPHVFLAPETVPTIDPYSHIVIVGNDINVRAEPDSSSPVVGTVSNEVVRYDVDSTSDLSAEQQQAVSTLNGWQSIITSTGQRGFVSSRYAYSPIGYRAFFTKENDTWQMTVFIAGD